MSNRDTKTLSSQASKKMEEQRESSKRAAKRQQSAASAPEAEKRSPSAWYAALRAENPPPRPGQKTELDWRHAAANTLHGWKRYEHHQGRKPSITRAAYEAALRAVDGDSTGAVKPVREALGH